MEKILLTVGICILVISILSYFIFKKKSLQTKFIKLQKEFEGFNIDGLQMRLEFVKEDSRAIDLLEGSYDYLTEINMDLIPSIEKSFNTFTSMYKSSLIPLSIKKLKNELLSIDKMFHKFKIKFLELTFKLNEVYTDIEIIDDILDKAKEKYGQVLEKLKNNSFSNDIDISYYQNDIGHIEKLFNEIDSKIRNENISVLNEKISILIETLASVIHDINYAIYAFQNLSIIDKKIDVAVSRAESTMNVLAAVFPIINKKIINVQEDSIEIKRLLKKRSIEKAKIIFDEIAIKIGELENLINLELDSYKILKKSITYFTEIIKNFETKNQKIIDEIQKRNFEDKKERLMFIQEEALAFEKVAKEFKKMKAETFQHHSPEQYLTMTSQLAEKYDKYLKAIERNVSDISVIISNTNLINQQIARANVLLLEIDYRVKQMTNKLQEKYENKISGLQDITNNFIEKYKTTKAFEITEEDQMLANKLLSKVERFSQEIFEVYYVNNYIKQLIMNLNKYRNRNNVINESISEIQSAYLKGELQLALRMGLKVCQINEIYE